MVDDRFDIEDNILYKYDSDGAAEVTIPEGITEIFEYAFSGCTGLEKVIMPDSVTKIGRHAFWGCTDLREIYLSKNLERIEKFAFLECGSIESITIPDGVKSIGNSAFRGCDLMHSVLLPDSIENIGESAFSDCFNLKNVSVPPKITVIKKRVFSDCKSLVSIHIPDSVTELDDYAFECCNLLEHIELPAALKAIGKHTFTGCSSLKELSIPRSVEYIGSSALYNTKLVNDFADDFVIVGNDILIQYKGEGETVTVPENVRVIGERAFAYCENIKSITIPEGVTRICDYAFEHCSALENVSLPSSLKILGTRAFVDCIKLAEIALPEDISYIGSEVFYGTELMADCFDELVVLNSKYLIRYSGESEDFIVPEGIEIIADEAFSGCGDLKNVIISDGVQVIGNSAFKWCRNIKQVKISGSVKYIGAEAFSSCEQLCAYIYQGSKILGDRAFVQDAEITFVNEERRFLVILQKDFSDKKSGKNNEQILFEFASSPSAELFVMLDDTAYMVPASVCYADTAEVFSCYLKNNIKSAVCYAVDRKDPQLLEKVLSFGFLSKEEVEFCVNYAIENNCLEQQVILMRFKQETFGSDEISDIIDQKFGL